MRRVDYLNIVAPFPAAGFLTSNTLHLDRSSSSNEKNMLGVDKNAVPPEPYSDTSASQKGSRKQTG